MGKATLLTVTDFQYTSHPTHTIGFHDRMKRFEGMDTSMLLSTFQAAIAETEEEATGLIREDVRKVIEASGFPGGPFSSISIRVKVNSTDNGLMWLTGGHQRWLKLED